MKALVTGGSGFVGSHLAQALVREGWEVTCVVRRSSSLRWLRGLPVEYLPMDLVRPSGLRQALMDVDVVFHVAGVTKGTRREDFFRGNALTTRSLVQACMESGNERLRFIHVSSLSAAGPAPDGRPRREEDPPAPVSWYGRSKLLAEEAVLRAFPPEALRILRPPVVYGPRDLDFLQVFRCVALGFCPVAGRGEQKIQFIHVNDLIRGILLAAKCQEPVGPVFFLSGEGAFDWLTVANAVGRAVGRTPVPLPVPIPVLRGAGALGTLLGRATGKAVVLNSDKVKEGAQPNWLCSSDKARKELGFQAVVPFEEGLASTASWYRRAGWLS